MQNTRELKLAMRTIIEKLAILVADVGSAKNFGWAGEWSDITKSGSSIDELAKTLVGLVQDDWRVSLGFEYLWEAFVTGKAKSDIHVGDAQKALRTFADALPDLEAANRVKCSRPISLAGLALLWSGLSVDVSVLHLPILVLRA